MSKRKVGGSFAFSKRAAETAQGQLADWLGYVCSPHRYLLALANLLAPHGVVEAFLGQ